MPRKVAWRVLHISRSRLDKFADTLGAANDLDLSALFAVALLAVDGDHVAPSAWRSAHVALSEWLTDPHQAPEARLWVSDHQASLTTEFPVDVHGLCVIDVLDRLRDLLRELEDRGLI